MQIFWKGQSCFYIVVQRSKQEQTRIVIDPFGPSIGLRLSRLEAEIVAVTHDHTDHNYVEGVEGASLVISTPGEYESREVEIQGIPSFHDDSKGKDRGQNIIYRLEAEGIRLCHVGDLGQSELSPEQLQALGDIDILFIPVGGVTTVDGKQAAHIVSQIEPRIVVPMHYLFGSLKMKLEKADDFLRVMGAKAIEPQSKLTLKRSDLTGEETKVIVLES